MSQQSSVQSLLFPFLQTYHCGNSECKYYNEEQCLDRPLGEELIDSGISTCLKCFSCDDSLLPCDCCTQLFSIGAKTSPSSNMIKFCSYCSFPNVCHPKWRRHDGFSLSEQEKLQQIKYIQLQIIEHSSGEATINHSEKEYGKHLLDSCPNDDQFTIEMFYRSPLTFGSALKTTLGILTEPKKQFFESDFLMLKSLYASSITKEAKLSKLFENIEKHFVKNTSLHSVLQNINQYILGNVSFPLLPNCSKLNTIKMIFKNQFLIMLETLRLELTTNLLPNIIEPLNEHITEISQLTNEGKLKSTTKIPRPLIYPFGSTPLGETNESQESLFIKKFELWRSLYFQLSTIINLLSTFHPCTSV
ncbi:predicted protein [Naegleria gruberi]|uniref:Predicted protein n=1 Tax=Naegleria gruberi TaxID=5762 RepID=D2V8G6_NAEGR|nr:uncharacterized protein NAEGRDRAFT_65148 [Naegleria gruberi]EFC46680.1 predicted protein [Naegleria gruberi]|eukprot:XP_002679424.1 predicted protein [Naegleria gruberi strain NEG-M]